MAVVINGNGTVTGISVGGLPDGIVDSGTLATNSVDSAELIDGSIDTAHIAADQITSAILPAGSVLQVVSDSYTGNFTTTSSTYAGTSYTDTITTTVANSKILITFNAPFQLNNGSNTRATLGLMSSLDSYADPLYEQILVIDAGWYQLGNSLTFLHSPSQSASTAITYRIYGRRTQGSASFYINDAWGINAGVGMASLTMMEIAG